MVGPELYLLFDFTKSYNYVLAAVLLPPLIVGNIILFIELTSRSTISLIAILIIIFDIFIISVFSYIFISFRRDRKRSN